MSSPGDVRPPLDAHHHDDRPTDLRQVLPGDGFARDRFVAGDDRYCPGVTAVRDRHAGGRGSGDGRAHARHHLVGHAGGGERIDLFAATAEQVGIAALQPDDRAPRPAERDEQVVDDALHVTAARALPDIDPLGCRRRQGEDALGHEAVVQHHLGRGQDAGRLQGQQLRITRAGADEEDRHLITDTDSDADTDSTRTGYGQFPTKAIGIQCRGSRRPGTRPAQTSSEIRSRISPQRRPAPEIRPPAATKAADVLGDDAVAS